MTRQSKTSVWHKQLFWIPPATHVNREGKRLACEKQVDWWPASIKPILQPYAIQNCSTVALTKVRLHMSLAARFLTTDVAQMVERSLACERYRDRCPASPIFQRSPEIKKGNTVGCFVRPKKTWICTSNKERKHLKQYTTCSESDWCTESPRFTSERRRRKHY